MSRPPTFAERPSAETRFSRNSPLARYLTLAYLALVAHASLYPFTGWRTPPDGVLAFVLADWPFYVTAADIILNVLGYLPLGLLLTLVLMNRMRAIHAALLGTVAGAGVSFVLELLQAWLPARISSNVDLLSNAAGAALGALAACLIGNRWLLSGELYGLRGRYFRAGTAIDIGFILLGVWLLTQLNAEIWLFGNGDLRHLVPGDVAVNYSAESYRYLEAGVAALNFAGVACMITAMARSATGAAVTLAGLTVLALGLKSIASAALLVPGNAKLWLTQGSLAGLAVGLVAWLLLSRLPRPALVWVAAVLLALGTVLVNIAPENPYLVAAIRVLQGGYYHGFNGLTRLLSAAWPFAVVAYLLFPARRAAALTPNA
jgi:VanZ family protein